MKRSKKTKTSTNKNKSKITISNKKLPPKPSRKRIKIQDFTTEILSCRSQENPKGILLARDELAGVVSALGRYNGAGDSDRAFMLEAHCGGEYSVDRVKERDEPIIIPHLSISLIGGIQPSKLRRMLLSGEDDGLTERILFTWPYRTPFSYVEDVFEGHEHAYMAFERLAALQPLQDEHGNTTPVTVRFSPKARAHLFNWTEQFEGEHLEKHSGMLAGHFAKYRGMAVRLALVLEYLWWSSQSDGEIEPDKISLKAIKAAIRLLEEYFKPMAIRTFSDAGTPTEQRNATTLAKWIIDTKPEVINVRNLYRKTKLSEMGDKESVLGAIAELEAAGWLRPKPERDGEGYGRKRSDYEVNPRLYAR